MKLTPIQQDGKCQSLLQTFAGFVDFERVATYYTTLKQSFFFSVVIHVDWGHPTWNEVVSCLLNSGEVNGLEKISDVRHLRRPLFSLPSPHA